jgi:hypothetical protein
MRIIVQELSIRQLSIVYARLPVDPGELAFFMDTYQSFLCAWVKDLLSAQSHYQCADTLS